jgi:hypothetical protein
VKGKKEECQKLNGIMNESIKKSDEILNFFGSDAKRASESANPNAKCKSNVI